MQLDTYQRNILEEIKKEWTGLFVSAKSPDRVKIEHDVEWIYTKSGLQKPKVVFVRSFQELLRMTKILACTTNSHEFETIDPILVRQFRTRLTHEIRQLMIQQLDDKVVNEIMVIEGYFSKKITTEVLVPLRRTLPYTTRVALFDGGFGLSEDAWVFTFEFVTRILRIDESLKEDFLRYCGMIKSGTWYLVCYKDYAIVCSSPIKIKKDEQGRLHSVSEAAVKWRDQRDDYFIHGVHFHKSLWEKVTKRELNIKDILQIQNIEQRHTAIQIFGYDTIIDELDAKLVSKSKRGNELYSIIDSLIIGRSLKLLKYECPSTGRIYHSFVPDDMYDADLAMAWKFNLSLDEYNALEIEA